VNRNGSDMLELLIADFYENSDRTQ